MNKDPEIKAGPIPYFSTTMRDGYSVPVRRSLFTAAIYGVPVFVLVLLIGGGAALWPLPVRWDVVVYLAVTLGMITFFTALIISWPREKERWMWLIEDVMKQDLNGDGSIGEPQKTNEFNTNPLPVWLSRNDKEEMSGIRGELPHREYLPALAAGLLEKKEFSQRKWAAVIPQAKFYEIQRAFVEYGLAKPANGKDGANGYVLTKAGVDTCHAIVNQSRGERRAMTAPLPYFSSK
jgi:hypothetical protein